MTTTVSHSPRTDDHGDARIASYQRMLLALASDLAARFDAVRLPIHILLENRFGELNENQEEMLEAARVSADAAGESMRKLRNLLELELGTLALSSTRQRPEDVFRSVVAAVAADARRHGVELRTVITPPVPAIRVDAARVREALTLLVADIIRQSTGGVVELTVGASDKEVVFAVTGTIRMDAVDTRLALALLAAQDARVDVTPRGAAVIFPVAVMDRLSPPISIV